MQMTVTKYFQNPRLGKPQFFYQTLWPDWHLSYSCNYGTFIGCCQYGMDRPARRQSLYRLSYPAHA